MRKYYSIAGTCEVTCSGDLNEALEEMAQVAAKHGVINFDLDQIDLLDEEEDDED